jgi:hypothetical protein
VSRGTAEPCFGRTVEGLCDHERFAGHHSRNFIQSLLIKSIERLDDASIAADQKERRYGEGIVQSRDCEIAVNSDCEFDWRLRDEFAGWAIAVLRDAQNL